MRKLTKSAGGFKDDFVVSKVNMYGRLYVETGDPLVLIQLVEDLKDCLDKEFSDALIKLLKDQRPMKLGIRHRQLEQDIVKLYMAHRRAKPEEVSRTIQQRLADRFGKTHGAVRKVLEKYGILPDGP